MKWRRRRERTVRDCPDQPEPTSLDEARQARAASEAGLQKAQAQDRAVRQVAGSLRDLRRDNHFAAMMAAVFRERKA